MRYQYNFGFFGQWMQANENLLSKNVIQKALGVKSNNSIKKWMEGERPLPIVSMLRLCNSFNIPLSAFFRDADADAQSTVIPLPNVNDQLEPAGGFDYNEEERQQGERTLLDPLDVTVMQSNIPGLELLQTREGVPEREATQREIVNGVSMQSLIDLEIQHKDQINKMLTIIADQQKAIADLTRQLSEVKHHRPMHYDLPAMEKSIAAEP